MVLLLAPREFRCVTLPFPHVFRPPSLLLPIPFALGPRVVFFNLSRSPSHFFCIVLHRAFFPPFYVGPPVPAVPFACAPRFCAHLFSGHWTMLCLRFFFKK
eukprot:RCo055215